MILTGYHHYLCLRAHVCVCARMLLGEGLWRFVICRHWTVVCFYLLSVSQEFLKTRYGVVSSSRLHNLSGKLYSAQSTR